MELLRGTAPKVNFYGPTPNTAITTVTYSVNGVGPIVGTFTPVASDSSAWELQLPYLGSDTNDVEVVWNFTIAGLPDFFDETFSYSVVTPYLTVREVKTIFPEASNEEAMEVEAVVRHVINAHTGQSFGFDRSKTLTVEGHGEGALRLPERLVQLEGVSTLTDILNPLSAIITSDGWYLKKRWTDVVSTRTTDNTYFAEDPRPGGIIYAPSLDGKAGQWREDYPFNITGDWGYKVMPTAVKEAARLLVNDYACSEVAYRDRYLESIKAADWRLQFSTRAWEYTGNVRADQLLSEYVILDWALI